MCNLELMLRKIGVAQRKATMRACALDPALTLPEPSWRAGQCAASAHAAN